MLLKDMDLGFLPGTFRLVNYSMNYTYGGVHRLATVLRSHIFVDFSMQDANVCHDLAGVVQHLS